MTWTTQPRSKVGPLAAMVAGNGQRVLLLHGVGLRSEAWAPIFTDLAQDYAVQAPDMLGHGATPRPDGQLRLDAYIDAVAAVVDGPVVVIGHSMGAVMALELAMRMPEHVKGVAALNAIFERDAAATAAIRKRAAALDGESATDPTVTLHRWFSDTQSPEREACDNWLRSINAKSYQLAYQAFAASDGPARADLANLTCPALFMTGAEEPNSTPAMSKAMAQVCANGRAVIAKGAAHMMPMTHPNQTIAELRTLLREVWP